MNINIKDGLPFILWDSMIGNKRKIFLTVLFLILIAGILSTIIFRVYRNHRDAKVFNELNNYIEYGSPGLHLINDETLTVANEITNMIMDYNTVNIIDADKNNCTLEVIYPDVARICKKIVDSSGNWDRSSFLASKTYFLDTLKNELESQNFEYLSQNFELKVIKNGGKYEFIETEEYMNAIYGGLLAFYNGLYEELGNKMEDN